MSFGDTYIETVDCIEQHNFSIGPDSEIDVVISYDQKYMQSTRNYPGLQ